jgi:hypothetical protein
MGQAWANGAPLAFAADDSESGGWSARFGLATREEEILLTAAGASERRVALYTLGPGGEPSLTLDGCLLVGAASNEPVEIREGYATFDREDFGGCLGIRQRDGVSVPLFFKP